MALNVSDENAIRSLSRGRPSVGGHEENRNTHGSAVSWWLKFHPHHLPVTLPLWWPWAYFKTPNIGFLICEMRMIKLVFICPVQLHAVLSVCPCLLFSIALMEMTLFVPLRNTYSPPGASHYSAPQVDSASLRCRKQLSIYLTNSCFIFGFSE